MNSGLLDLIGLGNIDIGIILLVLAGMILLLYILVIILLVKNGKLKKRLKAFTKGKDAKSLEEEIAALFEDNQFIKNNLERHKKDIRSLFKKTEHTYQKMGLVKYDAFNQMGGKLSFSLALLNEVNDGFIINSVHSVEGCYSYSKEIKAGLCAIALGKEEAEALAIAMRE